MPLLRLSSFVAVLLFAANLSAACGNPDLPPKREIVVQERQVLQQEQFPNAIAAADAASDLQLRALAFAVAVSHAREQPLAPTVEPESVVTNNPPVVSVATDTATSSQCGGDLPPCYVMQRESGGDYNAYNPTGCSGRSCGGAWQFDPLTWNNYGGYPQAQMAPPEVQDARARELWAGGAGCSHWAAC